MLADRKFVPDDDLVQETYDDFITRVGDDETKARKVLLERWSRGGTKIIVVWKETVGSPEVLDIIKKCEAEKASNAIVVHSSAKITNYADAAIRSLKTGKVVIETFSMSELQYNPARHVSVPRHYICSAAKKAEVLEQYAVTPNQVPKVLSTDPIIRYYGAAKGQLIKIVRVSESIPIVSTPDGKKELYDISYRIVV